MEAAQTGGSTDETRRRFAAARAGLAGDERSVRAFLDDRAAPVRAAAIVALVTMGRSRPADVRRALGDPDPRVRRATCELAGNLPRADFTALLGDPDPTVVEAAAFAVGETGDRRACPRLAAIAGSHADPLCRESAVAALGAIGDDAGRAAVLAALGDTPAIRRRAVVALAAFGGPDVELALRQRLTDHDWQVRQAAQEVLGISGFGPR
ncbi:MAG: HEAT repeat domain-containing protein [Acidimicrobiales bacterium]|jgi:HEAT repeat protein